MSHWYKDVDWQYKNTNCPLGCGSIIIWSIKKEVYVCLYCGWEDWTKRMMGEEKV